MLNVQKACGPDCMCARLLKEGAEQLAPSLVNLFNHSVNNGILPVDWVSPNVTPVYIRKVRNNVFLTTYLLA